MRAIRAKAIQTKKKKREFKILFVARSNVLLLVACINILFVLVKCACAAPKIILLLRTRVLSSFSLSRNLTNKIVSFHSFVIDAESSFIKVSSSPLTRGLALDGR